MSGESRQRGSEAESDQFYQLKEILSQIPNGRPETKAWSARMAAEWVLKSLFRDAYGTLPKKLTIPDLIKKINEKFKIDWSLEAHIKTITANYGNPSSHVHEGTGYTTLRQILPSLIALREMLTWYLEVYLQEPTIKVADLFPEDYDCDTFAPKAAAQDRSAIVRDCAADNHGRCDASSPATGAGRATESASDSPVAASAVQSPEDLADPRMPRDIALLQVSFDRCWRFEASAGGDIVATAVTLAGSVLERTAKEDRGVPLAISPNGDLAVTLIGSDAQLWELNPNTGNSSLWVRRRILTDAKSKSRVLAVREKGDDDAWVALESGGELLLATGFGEHRSIRTLLVPCSMGRPVRASFSRTSLIFLTDGEGGSLLHELVLGQKTPKAGPAAGEWNVLDMDVANVGDTSVTALLVKRRGTELIVEVEGRRRSPLELEGTPKLLGVVRAPTLPLESLCVLLVYRGDIKAHHPLRN